MEVEAKSHKGNLISFTGYATAGKDEAADWLVEKYGYVKVGWADPIYEIALVMNPLIPIGRFRSKSLVSLVEKLGWTKAKTIPAVRDYLQRLGSEGGRNVLGPNVWVDALTPKIKKLLRSGKSVVVTNTRFANEAHAIIELAGDVVKIERPGTGPINDHASDAGEAFKFAFAIIKNDGSKEELRQRVTVLHESISDEKRPSEDEESLSPDVMIAKYQSTVERSIQIGVSTVLRIAAPASEEVETWSKRHRIAAISDSADGDSIDIIIDDEDAGNVTYADGVLTIDAFIARH